MSGLCLKALDKICQATTTSRRPSFSLLYILFGIYAALNMAVDDTHPTQAVNDRVEACVLMQLTRSIAAHVFV